jgi:hypothetical protein
VVVEVRQRTSVVCCGCWQDEEKRMEARTLHSPRPRLGPGRCNVFKYDRIDLHFWITYMIDCPPSEFKDPKVAGI